MTTKQVLTRRKTDIVRRCIIQLYRAPKMQNTTTQLLWLSNPPPFLAVTGSHTALQSVRLL